MKTPKPKTKKTDKPKTKKTRETDPLKQMAKFIESHGWKVIVIGPARIHQPFGSLKHNYEFVVNFTGVKKKRPA